MQPTSNGNGNERRSSLLGLVHELSELHKDLPTRGRTPTLTHSGGSHYLQGAGKNLGQFTDEKLAKFIQLAITSLPQLVDELKRLRGVAGRTSALVRLHESSRRVLLDELTAAADLGLGSKQGQARVREALAEAREEIRLEDGYY